MTEQQARANQRHAVRQQRSAPSTGKAAAAPDGDDDSARQPGPPSALTVSLALYSFLEDGPIASLGMTQAELHRVWPCSGLPDAEFEPALARALETGELELITTRDGDRIRPRYFEKRRLDPKNLDEIQDIVYAYLDLAAYRRVWMMARKATRQT